MPADKYHLQLTGKVLSGHDETSARKNLSRLLKCSPEQSDALISKQATVKKCSDAAEADKYCRALERTGIECRVYFYYGTTADAMHTARESTRSPGAGEIARTQEGNLLPRHKKAGLIVMMVGGVLIIGFLVFSDGYNPLTGLFGSLMTSMYLYEYEPCPVISLSCYTGTYLWTKYFVFGSTVIVVLGAAIFVLGIPQWLQRFTAGSQ